MSIKFGAVALFFFVKGSGEDETDEATDHESFELSELNDKSITPFGLPGIHPILRFLNWWLFFLDAFEISLLHSSTFPCFENNSRTWL